MGPGLINKSDRRLRALHVIPSVSQVHGGPSTAIAVMEKALVEAGVSVVIATTDDDGPRRRLARVSVEQDEDSTTRFYARKWLDMYKVAPSIVPWLWHNLPQFDVVHIHALFSFSSVAASLLARRRRIPYVIRPLGTLAPYGMTERRPWLKKISLRLLEGPILRHAAAVHFTSEAERAEAQALGIELRARVIPLGIELSGSEPDRCSAVPEVRGRRLVLYLGRLDKKKNVEGLLRAASLIDWENIGAVLLIAGDGELKYIRELKYLASSLGIADNVRWLGHVGGARKARLLAAADLFVLPSFSENFGLAVAEALLAGTPCVLSERIGIALEAEEAGAARVVSVEPEDISSAITTLLNDDGARRDMAVNAKRFAGREYSTAMMAERLIVMYRDVTGWAASRVAT